MSSINLLELIPRCHAGSRAKGFWDITPNKGQQLMLVISELAEALEADRKEVVSPTPERLAQIIIELAEMEEQHATSRWQGLFISAIKDTPADELADAYIRLCDYAGGFGLDASAVVRGRNSELLGFDKVPEQLNLGECLLAATEAVVEINTDGFQAIAVGKAQAVIEYVAGLFNIDLATHIDLKLQYNATRPAKHGKAY